MTRLLDEVSSFELSAWQQYFVVEQERNEAARRRAKEDAEYD